MFIYEGIKNFFRKIEICAKILSLFVENDHGIHVIKVYTNVDPVLRRAVDQITAGDWL